MNFVVLRLKCEVKFQYERVILLDSARFLLVILTKTVKRIRFTLLKAA